MRERRRLEASATIGDGHISLVAAVALMYIQLRESANVAAQFPKVGQIAGFYISIRDRRVDMQILFWPDRAASP